MPSRGFVYVVNTERYLDECLVSYRSLREHMPGERVAIVTHPELYRDIEGIEWAQLARRHDAPTVKIEAYNAPFDDCIFLDSDTRVIRDVRLLFDVLEGFDLALAHEPLCGWDYPTEAARAFTELNTGVIVFRKSERLARFFALWAEIAERMRREHQMLADQPSFREALWKCRDVRHTTLAPEFHLITIRASGLTWDAHILHGRNDLAGIAAAINQRTGPRAFVPEYGNIFSFNGRRSLLENFWRISKRTLHALLSNAPAEEAVTPGDWQTGKGKKNEHRSELVPSTATTIATSVPDSQDITS